jgi:uncharacterized membrane protein
MSEGKDAPVDEAVAMGKGRYRGLTGIYAPSNGYLRYRDVGSMLSLMEEADGMIHLRFRTGQYLVKGEEMGTVYTNNQVGDDLLEDLNDQLIIGSSRTPQQDIEFLLLQMVEIAVRALSSGINDPFTAIACIDNLSAALSQMAGVAMPARYHFGEDGVLRTITETIHFGGLVDAAFNQIRQNAAAKPAVLISVVEALKRILQFTGREADEKTIYRHIKLVMELGANTIAQKADLEDLKERLKGLPQLRSSDSEIGEPSN